MNENKFANFCKIYAGAIIGALIGIILVAFNVVKIIMGIVIIIGMAALGAYIQRNKVVVKDKLKRFIDKI